MNETPKSSLFDVFESLYFHEFDSRDKIFSRCQLAFASLGAGYSILIYMVRNLDVSLDIHIVSLLVFLLFSAFVISLFSLRLFIKSFHGNEYRGLAYACKIEKYKSDLIEYQASIESYNVQNPSFALPNINVDKEMSDYIEQELVFCASFNCEVNDRRSMQLNDGFTYLIFSAVPLLFAGFIFVFANADNSNQKSSADTPTIIFNKSTCKEDSLNGL